jgi:hypothetical protein
MQQQVTVNGYFSGFQFNIDWLSQFFSVRNSLVQNIPFIGLTQLVGQMAQVMRAWNKTHAGIFDRGIIDCQPRGHGHRRRHWPIA